MIAEIAEPQHGVVTRGQLLGAGVTAAKIKRRLNNGALHRVHRGVYRVGHRAPSLRASYLAAVLACGEGAMLSGRAAGYLLRLLSGTPPAPEVTCRTERRVKGVRIIRSRRIDPRERTVAAGIPVSTVARTLVDLAGGLAAGELAWAWHQAVGRHHIRAAEVGAVLARRPNSRGARNLRRAIHGDERVTASVLERRFLALLRNCGLPLPVTNRLAGGRSVDCRWPEHRLTVELDGYRYHHSRHAWEQDRRRERQAYARGDEFRRYTYGDVFERPRQMLRELRALLPNRRAG